MMTKPIQCLAVQAVNRVLARADHAFQSRTWTHRYEVAGSLAKTPAVQDRHSGILAEIPNGSTMSHIQDLATPTNGQNGHMPLEGALEEPNLEIVPSTVNSSGQIGYAAE
jgi:hypothetical protein